MNLPNNNLPNDIDIDKERRIVYLGEHRELPFYAIKKLASIITLLEEEDFKSTTCKEECQCTQCPE